MIVSTAARDPQSLPESRRLWSLWDMLEKNARQFFDLTQHISSLHWLINGRIMASADSALAHAPVDDRQLTDAVKEKLREAQTICEELELDAALAAVDRLLSRCSNRYSPTYGEVSAQSPRSAAECQTSCRRGRF